MTTQRATKLIWRIISDFDLIDFQVWVKVNADITKARSSCTASMVLAMDGLVNQISDEI